MKALIMCECSGKVKKAFMDRGHFAISVDILPSLVPVNHLQQDIRTLPVESIKYFDLVVAFPPCTHLASSGAKWFEEKRKDGRQQEALELIKWIMDLPVNHIAIENPVGIISTHIKPATQYIQPWQFGHGETKRTGLWLKNLPKLVPTNIVDGREQRIWKMSRTKDRAAKRSITYDGIACAMADQWGEFVEREEYGI